MIDEWKRERNERAAREHVRKTTDAARRRAATLADLHWSGRSTDNIPSEFVDSREKERPSDPALNGDNPSGSSVGHEVFCGADMRGCDRIGERPATLQPILYKLPSAVQPVRPLSRSECFSVVGDKYVNGFVVSLLGRCGPSAIFRAVAFVAINAVNARPIWSRPHVGHKVLKIKPSFANVNTLAAVIPIARRVCIEAPLFHPSPNLVDGFVMHPVFFSGASAGRDVPEGNSVNRDFFAAVTNAMPPDFSVDALRQSNGSQSPIPQPSSVNDLFHFVTSKLLTVKDAWHTAVKPFFGSYPSHAM